VRVLIVKLSSLGDVVHAMPVVNDIHQAHPGVLIDWVVEPAFSPLLVQMDGVDDVIECPLRRWRRTWRRGCLRDEWQRLHRRLRQYRYDAVLDLQGLTKSAVIARLANGTSYGLANRTDGSSFEAPARWLVNHSIRVPAQIHALDRSRELAARALEYVRAGPPIFGLRPARSPPRGSGPTLVLAHGTSRADKLWSEAAWIEIGRRALRQGWNIGLPRAGSVDSERALRIAAALGPEAQLWPEVRLDLLLDRMSAAQGVIGVDSGLSHVAVALDLPHVQIYNFPTAWRTGPQNSHGRLRQVCVYADAGPSVDAVWDAWLSVSDPNVLM
jgi:heptosyltransferase-1